jgi:eukaryotic-like serine/threonine-protein kinase
MSVIPTANATKQSNEPIPGYKLVKRIGAGGYGEVWTAEAPGELIKAIKFVYGLLDEDRAARELKALNRIKGVRHPFLLSLERIEVVEGQLLIVTELADCSLKDRFEEERKANKPGFERDDLLAHLRDAADALDYMSDKHSLQHLDVKPENLLLVGGRIKVADFGLVKDVHDVTASMMGGLTPIYAPPEVFEGRPTRRSDQYSLAIVYQEMLTGVLPFPGRTAAQLAAQHLNAKPRLTALPENDQPVIARALSKKPTDRFNSCRELIDGLVEAGRRSPGSPPPSPAVDANSASVTTATRLPADMLANLDATTRAVQQLTSATGFIHPSQTSAGMSRPVRFTHSRSTRLAKGAEAPVPDRAPELDALQKSPPLVDVPPPEIDPQTPPLRPTLFIGLGGCGGKVLKRVRRRLNDRLPAELQMLAPMILFDTDSREISEAAYGDDVGHLKPEEALAMPLRRSQDYREDSRKILEWLSRRWLFNIPRSLQTEGLRPLGRLALVDHSIEVTKRLKQAIDTLHADASKVQLFPRVVLVASAAGGTGGGMVTDIAFLVRQLIEKLPEGAQMEVMAVLVHGTNRNPQQQELAAANTVATLTELCQFHRPGSVFPGDPACGLAAREAGSGALDVAYLIHAGEDLSPQQMDTTSDRVAEFLMLDTVTPAGNLLEACRLESSETPGLKLHSFGLYQFGFAHDKLLDESVNRICRSIVQRLSGPAATPEQKKSSLLQAAPLVVDSQQQPPADPLGDLDHRAATLVRTMGLDVEPLMQVVQQFSAVDMGGDPEAFFRKLMVVSPQGEPLLEKWIKAANDLFGLPHSNTSIKAEPGELSQALDERVGPWIAQVGTGLREWIEAIVEDPHCRVIGAKRAAKWFQEYLKALVDRLAETRARFAREIANAAQTLAGVDKVKGKPARRTPQDLANSFLLYCRLRLFELSAQRAGQIAHSLQSHAVGAHDAMVDLQRDLTQLAGLFPVNENVAATPAAKPAAGDMSAVRSSVAQELKAAEESLARQLEEQLSQSFIAPSGGLRTVITTGGEVREKLLDAIRSGARQAALAKVQSLDLASVLLKSPDGESPLARCVAEAQPWLERCGGRRRLIFVVPQQLIGQYSTANIAAQLGSSVFGQLPGIAPGTSSDLALLIELSDISLPHAAANLIDFRRDLAEAAGRLQTRSDVQWTPVFAF